MKRCSTHEFDVSPDGQRFLIGTLIAEPTAPPPTVDSGVEEIGPLNLEVGRKVPERDKCNSVGRIPTTF